MRMIKNKNTNIKSQIQNICLTSMFISLTMLFKYIGQFILITGFPLEIELVVFLVGLIVINEYKYKLFLLILAPFLWLLISPPFFFNYAQLFIEYLLPPFLFILISFSWTLFKNKSKLTINIALVLTIFILFIIKCSLHIIAGYFWWTEKDWIGSFLINIRIIGINLVFILPLSITIINIILKNKNIIKIDIDDFKKSSIKKRNST